MKNILKMIAVSLVAFCLFLCGGCGVVSHLGQTGEIYYETTIEFYVSPKKTDTEMEGADNQYGVYGAYGNHVMENIIKLLESESFFTTLLEEMGDGASETVGGSPVKLGEYVDYSYLGSTNQTDTVDPLARSFIYAKISVSEKEGRAFAENLRSAVIEQTKLFVEENMPIPEGYSGTHCAKITRSDELREVKK